MRNQKTRNKARAVLRGLAQAAGSPKISTLTLAWATHGKAGDPNALRFRELVIDGVGLGAFVHHGKVTPFGWGTTPTQLEAIDRLLTLAPGDLPGGRVSLLVCHVCGDLGCRAVGATVERRWDLVSWRDLGEDDPLEGTVHTRGFEGVGPFHFEETAYRGVLEQLRREVLEAPFVPRPRRLPPQPGSSGVGPR